ncbi:Hypothetical predicted protein [Paramuricea clavata]|uniref:Uncharacterized protein n=1 Tax=Paramuricea clavata TaxID=317549 RepID=A0A7D9JMT2_PARCT|nr:Hypothetical predicted protein [Paramuricea clavata]
MTTRKVEEVSADDEKHTANLKLIWIIKEFDTEEVLQRGLNSQANGGVRATEPVIVKENPNRISREERLE